MTGTSITFQLDMKKEREKRPLNVRINKLKSIIVEIYIISRLKSPTMEDHSSESTQCDDKYGSTS